MIFCSIASGSSGNCAFVGDDNSSLLLDAGISGARIERGLREIDRTTKDVDGILVTHEHSDHVRGLGVLARRHGIPIYATGGTFEAIDRAGSAGEIPEELRHVVRADAPFFLGDLRILPFAISHDAREPVGYRIEGGGKSCAVATDMGCYDEYVTSRLSGLDVLLLEANHDVRMLESGRYPYYVKRRILSDHGHLSNEAAGRLLGELLNDKVRHVFLGHLSKENNYEALAYETVCTEVTMGDNPWSSKDFAITIARRDSASEPVAW